MEPNKILLFFAMTIIAKTSANEESQSPLYDAKSSITSRTSHYRRVCEKYRDPRRPQYKSLFQPTPLNPQRLAHDIANKFYVCAPPKVGSDAWSRLTRKLSGQSWKGMLKKDVVKVVQKAADEDWFKQGTRVIVTRHPLERLLSSYLFIFVDSSTHRDLTKKVTHSWLHQRKSLGRDPLNENHVVLDAGREPTLSFRQFVNFLTECPKELSDCSVMTSEGVAGHWAPYWKWCQPCRVGYEYDYVMELSHAQEDKEFIFSQNEALNASVPFDLSNPTRAGSASNLETKRKFYGQLTKVEITRLYEKFRLDHELFGYTPDEFIAMAKDS